MEIRVNLVLIAVLGLVWLGLKAHAPARIETATDMDRLAELEDAFARDRADKDAVLALTQAYLEENHPVLAVTVLTKVSALVIAGGAPRLRPGPPRTGGGRRAHLGPCRRGARAHGPGGRRQRRSDA